MDVTLQQIEQQVFPEKFRGYDPDQVDEFLEQVGATLARLRDELKAQTDRAQRAETVAAQLRDQLEQSPAAPPPPSEEDEIAEAASTLALAKRTADAAVAEARADAERILRDASTERDALLHRAQEDARAEYEARVGEYRALLADLDTTKAQLADDVGRLEGRLGEYRTVLSDVHTSIGSLLDDPDGLRVRSSLDIDATPTEPPPSPFYSTASTPAVTDAGPPTEAITPDEVTGGDPWGPGSWAEVSASLADEPFEPQGGVVESVATEPARAEDDAEQDDRYLQELHDAVNAEDTAPEDPAMEEFFEEDSPRPKRFSRRR